MNFTTFKKSNRIKSVAFFMSLLVLFVSWTPPKPAVVLKAGTNIPLETLSQISTATIAVGQIIDFRVTRDIVADDVIVIEAGSIAKGQVVRADVPKAIGKPGFVEVKVTSVNAVDGQEVFLTGGNVTQEGDDKAVIAIVLGVFLCLLFLLKKGKDGVVPAGFTVVHLAALLIPIILATLEFSRFTISAALDIS